MSHQEKPLALAVVNDFPVVAAGLSALLEPHRDRVRLRAYVGELPPPGAADVVLFDPFGHPGRDDRLGEIISETGAKVVVYSWAQSAEQIDRALALGAAGFLSKTTSGAEIVVAVQAVDEGHVITRPSAGGSMLGWPGQPEGLTARESEVVCLIVAGLSNQDIARELYVSINSIKSYIRTAYRKMGVTTRSRAILWAIDHGFRPEGS